MREPSPSAPANSGRDEAAQWVRTNLPTCSQIADDFRAVFPTVRLTHASEAGHSIGKPIEEPAFSVSGDDLVAHPVRVKP